MTIVDQQQQYQLWTTNQQQHHCTMEEMIRQYLLAPLPPPLVPPVLAAPSLSTPILGRGVFIDAHASRDGPPQQQQQQQQLKEVYKQQQQNREDVQQLLDIKMAPLDPIAPSLPCIPSTSSSVDADIDMKPAVTTTLQEALSSPPHVAMSPASNCNSDSSEDLFNEMEEFLSHHSPKQDNPLSFEQMQQAEEIVDALVSGELPLNPMEDDSNRRQVVEESVLGSVNPSSISNISETVTKDGQRVVIVIASDQMQNVASPVQSVSSPIGQPLNVSSPLGQQFQNVSSPMQASPLAANLQMMSPTAPSSIASSFYDDSSSSDPEWNPNSPDFSAKRRLSNSSDNNPAPSTSSGRVTKRRPKLNSGKYNLGDKKERKKLQNVVAARKYRDRKKSEQQVLEQEEEELEERNRELRGKMGEVESELRTLKKLMVELGLVKVPPQIPTTSN